RSIIESGIVSGHALEIGHGPGYLGLEWLKNTTQTRLTGLDISPDMSRLAMQNARSYALKDRVKYDCGRGDDLPYEDNLFDAVFTNGSLHEWSNPLETFNEIFRVLKPGGLYFISDLRRDMPFYMRYLLWWGTKPAFIRPYLISSINAAYTAGEIKGMLKRCLTNTALVESQLIGIKITGKK
ncbi:MAG: class I SAM-dependent methyltransferase, partial [Anaerolineae bacterium]|nr:class I SAM-dependent methyltransferase [Anaerolineae bacterium]